MKILVTGKNGYIARSFAERTRCDLISLRDDTWKNTSFAEYDVILHAAAIVHKRETRFNRHKYYLINRDLCEDLAKKAKADGVRQFIFLSSISVFGINCGVISHNTPLNPTTHYGRSKLAAESLLQPLADDNFKIAVLRPPMVYGPDCPGNYAKLRQMVKALPIFPNYPNKRSIVGIDNLCGAVNDIIINSKSGIFYPKDPYPVSTTQMAENIAAESGKKLKTTTVFNNLIDRTIRFNTIQKLFGSLVLDI